MKSILSSFLILFFFNIYGQKLGELDIGIESNSQFYIDDKKIGGFDDNNNFRSNNYLNFNYYLDKISAQIKFESYAPEALLNYSPQLNKSIALATYSIKYQTKKLNFTLGNFYDLFGSGLIFRSYEDRKLGLDNSIRGIKILYHTQKLSLTGFVGKQRIGFKLSNNTLFGFNSEIDIVSNQNRNLALGFSYIGRKHKDSVENLNANNITSLYSGRIDYSINNFYSNVEFVYKADDALIEFGSTINSRLFNGNALLYNLGYTKKGIGVDATFRRIENMALYSDNEVYLNSYNDQIVNYIPSLTKQHNLKLASIYVYQSQPQLTFIPFGKSGEIGAQFDFFYNFKRKTSLGGKYGTKISLNASQWNRLKATYDLNNRYYKSEFLAFGDKNYRDINIEISKKWSTSFKSKLKYINQFYDKAYLEEKTGHINANIIGFDINYNFNSKKSIYTQLEHLWSKDDKKNWFALTVEYNFSSKLSLFTNEMYNYGNDNDFDRIHYYNLGFNYTNNKTRVSLSYGRQRGGLICIGGICRFVPSSNGLTMSFSTAL